MWSVVNTNGGGHVQRVLETTRVVQVVWYQKEEGIEYKKQTAPVTQPESNKWHVMNEL